MTLHVERIGRGAPLLLIHGWGMHGGVWDDVAERLAEDFNVHIADLPGYGYSESQQATTLDAIVDEFSAGFSGPLAVCGWSLGGQVALRWAAREPGQLERLILVTSTPCFTERTDWEHGMARHVFEQFAAELEQNYAAALRRFLALQLRGSENERELLAQMRERLFSRGTPDMDALRGGLEILRVADLRGDLQYIGQPTLAIAGERDKLASPAASHFLAQAMPAARAVEIAGAAHAPFLSHPDAFVAQIRKFLHE